MNPPSLIQILAAILFGLAVLHTFSTKFFEHLAHTRPRHAGFWHLLGEVEIVFGFWALILMLFMFGLTGSQASIAYLNGRNFTEPMFVFVIMVIAGTRPVLEFTGTSVRYLTRFLPLQPGQALFFLCLAFVPLLGSFITEPAAMTLAALMLRDTVFSREVSTKLKYATLGVLFVNISIGGTLTPFAAPPVLMVAAKWNWDLMFMLSHFGWRAALAVSLNAALLTFWFRKDLGHMTSSVAQPPSSKVPLPVVVVHLLFLMLVVIFGHHPVMFMGLFLFFLGFTTAYQRYQNPLILREALLVGFFLGGLVVLGGQQQWWLEPVLMSMSADTVFYGAVALTAITDNAALTYLGSLVEGLSLDFKLALVAGAVTGGGLTIIANAPNPAGATILKEKFSDNAIQPLGLLIAALPPTLIAIVALRWI
jgi:Putative Na+/H+ antiporter